MLPAPPQAQLRQSRPLHQRPARQRGRGHARRGVRSLSLLVDTNVIVATADDADPDHERCQAVLEGHAGPLVTTGLVVAEAGWLIDRQLGPAAEADFYRSIAAGELRVEALTAGDWTRMAELVDTYADLRLGGVDASVIAVAERLDVREIATLDRRHFTVVRPAHRDAFELVP